MAKVKTFSAYYLIDLELEINKFCKFRRIISSSIATKTTIGISRDSGPSTYFVALVTYEDK